MKKRAKIKLIKSKNRVIHLARYLVYFIKLFVWKIKHKPKWKKTAKISVITFICLIISFASFLGIKKILSIPRAPKIKIADSNSPFIYTAKAKEFEVSLGDKKTNTPKIEFSVSGNKITFTPASGREKINEPTIEDKALIFREVYPKVDYKYQTTPKGIKEEIIIKQPTIIKQFPFYLDFEGVKPKYIAENLAGGVFYDENNNYLFHFEKPFAYDSAGARTEDVQLLVKRDIETKKYVAIIGIDPTWVDSPERVYPIYIDPTVVHDTSSEFATGQLNRVQDTGSGSSPNLETYYQELPADEHTVGLWHMDETVDNSCSGGEDACDSSGNGYHGTATGTTIETSTQMLGNAARTFNGTSDFVATNVDSEVGSLFADTGNAWTVETWFKTSSGSTNRVMVGRGGGIGTSATFALYVDSSNDLLSDLRGSYSTIGTGVADNNWHYAVITWDGTTAIGYLDGSSPVILNIGTAAVQTNTVYIGATANGANSFFSGSIDEVRLSNNVRSPEEIKLNAQRRPYSIYTSDSINLGSVYTLDSLEWTELGVQTGDGETVFSSTGLVSQWNFNETSGTAANNDAEGTSCGGTPANCDGVLTGFSNTTGQDVAAGSGWTSDNRRWGAGALMFNASSDYIDFGLHKFGPLLNGASAVTVEYWLRVNAYPTAGNEYQVIAIVNSTGGAIDTKVDENGKVKIGGRSTSGDTFQNATSNKALEIGIWHLVSGVYDYPNDTIKIYIDGKLDTTQSVTFGATTYTDSAHGSLNDQIGNFESTSRYLNATMDSSRLYTRALSENEILANYNSGQIEFQTRTSADGSSWEAWKPTTNETQILSLDDDSSNWQNEIGSSTPTLFSLEDVNPAAPTGPTGCSANKPVFINNLGNISTLTNYQAKINVDYLTGMASDFSDLRFTNSSGTDLDYWLESHTASTNATVWVEVNSIAAKKTTAIYMWYNSCTGGNTTNGNDTFLFFDDFNGASLDAAWTTSEEGAVSVTSGYAYPSSFGTGAAWHGPRITANLSETITTSGGVALETKIFWQNNASDMGIIRSELLNSGSRSYSNSFYDSHENTAESAEYLHDSTTSLFSACTAVDADCLTSGTWTTITVRKNESSTVKYIKNEAPRFNGSGINSQVNQVSINFDQYTTYTAVTMRTDYIFVRKHSNPEPTVKISSLTSIYSEGTSSIKLAAGTSQADSDTVALWHLNETSGTGAYIKDSSPNANNGTPTGTTVVNGIAGKARDFNGTSDYVQVLAGSGSPLDLDTNPITMEAWIKPNSLSGEQHIISRGQRGTAGYGLAINYSSGLVNVGLHGGSNFDGTTALVPGQWYHVVGIINDTSSAIYVNGKLDAAGTVNVVATDLDLHIGSSWDGATQAYFYDGMIDEVRISNTVRSAEEIAEAYRMGRGHKLSRTISSTDLSSKGKLPFYIAADRPGTYLEASVGESNYVNQETDANTVGYWHLEEESGSGAYLKDSSSYGNNGTPSGAAFTQGKIGGARKFDGLNDYISIAHNSTLEPSNLSMEAWINVDSSITPELYAVIIDKPHSSHVDPYYNYHIRLGNLTNTKPDLLSCVMVGVGGGNDCISLASSITKNSWHHIVVTFDETTQKLYLDGQLRGSVTNVGSIYYSQQSLYIGAFKNLTNGNFPGLIDEVRISSTARTADEIRQAYEIGTRTHPITIDFAASLDSGNLITGSGDTSFTVDATTYGLSDMGSQLFIGDKIIVKENVDGTEYIAQGDVTAITTSTGATTIDAWDTGSTFPTGGFTASASVFKWQREYWDITQPLDSQINAITNLTLRIANGDEGRTIWLDDLESSGDYLTDESGSTITSTAQDYFQYRAILSSTDTNVAPSLTSITLNYTENTAPGAPTINASYLHDKLKTADSTPEIRFAATDTETDDLSYQVQWDTDSSFPAPSSAVSDTDPGFSNITTPADNDPFNSGDTISYVFQSALTTDTTYFYKIRAKDPGGTNTYGNFSSIRSFTIDTSLTGGNAWFETHADQFTTDTLTGNAQVNDSGNYIEVSATTGTATSTAITAANINSSPSTWGHMAFTDDETFGDIKYKVYYDVSGTPTIIPDVDLPGNSTGFDTSPIDLSGLSTTTYSILYAYADLTYSGGSPQLQDWTISFNLKPNSPTLNSPSNGALTSTTPDLKLTATDPDSDNLKYKIELDTVDTFDSGDFQTFDQTSSQAGWSGQDAETGTAYASGTQATYTIQSALTKGETYYWRGYAIDENGSAVWSTYSSTGNFDISQNPTAPTSLLTEEATNPTNVSDTTPEFSALCNDPDAGQILNKYQIQVDDDSDFSSTIWDSGSSGTSMTDCTAGNRSQDITYGESALTLDGETYYWRIKFWDDLGLEGVWDTEGATFAMATHLTPSNCTIQENVDDSSLIFSWTDNSTIETQYRIERNVSAAGFLFLINKAVDSQSHEDTGVSQGNTYQYRVRAENGTNTDWCTTSTLTLSAGTFELDGLNFQGVDIQ